MTAKGRTEPGNVRQSRLVMDQGEKRVFPEQSADLVRDVAMLIVSLTRSQVGMFLKPK